MDSCSQVFSFLSEKDQENLGLVNTITNQVKIQYAVKGYKCLLRKLNQNNVLVIKDADVVYTITLGKILGSGGNKQAIELDEQRALLIPNEFCLPHALATETYWKRMVQEEVGMARVFTRLGLLTPIDRQVLVLRSPTCKTGFVPAFLSLTFESLAKKGIFFLSSKDRSDSTWKFKEHFFFRTAEERQQEKNWDPLFKPVLKDVEKIFAYKLPAFDDAFNLAIVKKSEDRYEIRYFGYDFAGRFGSLEIPNLDKRATEIDSRSVKNYVQLIVETIFLWESGGYGEEYTSYTTLRDTLVEKYTKIVLSRMA